MFHIGPLGPAELILIGIVIILLFGPKRIADVARSFGESLREFKKGATADKEKTTGASAEDSKGAEDGKK